MSDKDKFKTFIGSYRYQGRSWGFEILAQNLEDAEARFAAMHWGQIDGELMAVIPAGVPGTGIVPRFICWLKNTLGTFARSP